MLRITAGKTEVDQEENQPRAWEDQLGYCCKNSGTAKGLKESNNRGRAEKLKVMAYAALKGEVKIKVLV